MTATFQRHFSWLLSGAWLLAGLFAARATFQQLDLVQNKFLAFEETFAPPYIICGLLLLFGAHFGYVLLTNRAFLSDPASVAIPRLTLSLLIEVYMVVTYLILFLLPWEPKLERVWLPVLTFLLSPAVALFVTGALCIANVSDRVTVRTRGEWPSSRLSQLLLCPGQGRFYSYVLAHLFFFVMLSLLLPRLVAEYPPPCMRLDLYTPWYDTFFCLCVLILALSFLGAGSSFYELLSKLHPSGRYGRGRTMLLGGLLWTTISFGIARLLGTLSDLSPTPFWSPDPGLDLLALVPLAIGVRGLLGITAVMGFALVPTLYYWGRDILTASRENRQIASKRWEGSL